MKFRFSVSNYVSAAALTLVVAPSAQAGTIVQQWGQYGDIPVPARFFAGSRMDLVVFRPLTGTWFVRSLSGVVRTQQWGAPGDIPMPGDIDGDGLADFVVFRPATATWHVLNSVTGVVRSEQWGMYTDVPAAGDYDGDGRMDFAVWRPNDGMWWVKNSVTGAVTWKQWGTYGDIPVPGTYDGWIGDDFTVFRPSSGPVWSRGIAYWHTYGSSTQFGLPKSTQWGEVGDIPVSGHFDCYSSGPAIFRPLYGTWWIPGRAVTQWGAPGDIPVAADYLGSAAADFAVFRPSSGTWFVLENPDVCIN